MKFDCCTIILFWEQILNIIELVNQGTVADAVESDWNSSTYSSNSELKNEGLGFLVMLRHKLIVIKWNF